MPVPPSSLQAAAGAHLIVNLSASDEMAGKHAYLRSLVEQQSARAMSAYLYCSAGFGESTTDMVFAGNALIAENGTMLGESERFSFDEQLLIREVDIERLQAVRRRTNTFGLKGSAPSFRRIAVEWPRYAGSDTLLRTFDPHPFVRPTIRAATSAAAKYSTSKSAVWPSEYATPGRARPSSAYREDSIRRWRCS